MFDIMIGIVLFFFALVMSNERNVVWRRRDWAIFYTVVGVAAFCCTYGLVTIFLEK